MQNVNAYSKFNATSDFVKEKITDGKNAVNNCSANIRDSNKYGYKNSVQLTASHDANVENQVSGNLTDKQGLSKSNNFQNFV